MCCHDLEVMGLNASRVELRCIVRLSKLYFGGGVEGQKNIKH